MALDAQPCHRLGCMYHKVPMQCQLVVLLYVEWLWLWGAWLCYGASHTGVVNHLCAAVLGQAVRAHAVE